MTQFKLRTAVAAAACTFVTAGIALAQSAQSLYRPVILVGYLVKPAQVREDGSGFQPISFSGGDLRGARFGGSRYFLTTQRRGASTYYDLMAVHESTGAVTALTTAESLQPSGPRWATGGARVAFTGRQLDATGTTVVAEGLFLADVVTDATGAPASVQNVRLLVAKPADTSGASGSTTYTLNKASWSGDDARLAFILTTEVKDASGARISLTPRVHVVPADPVFFPTTSTPLAITGLPAPGPYTGFIDNAKASPVPGDGRVMLQVTDHFRGTWVSDELYTVNVPAGYSGSSSLAAAHVTTGQNLKDVPTSDPFDWSPDGVWVALSVITKSGGAYQVDRMKADGSTSATVLLGNRSTSYRLDQWRP